MHHHCRHVRNTTYVHRIMQSCFTTTANFSLPRHIHQRKRSQPSTDALPHFLAPGLTVARVHSAQLVYCRTDLQERHLLHVQICSLTKSQYCCFCLPRKAWQREPGMTTSTMHVFLVTRVFRSPTSQLTLFSNCIHAFHMQQSSHLSRRRRTQTPPPSRHH